MRNIYLKSLNLIAPKNLAESESILNEHDNGVFMFLISSPINFISSACSYFYDPEKEPLIKTFNEISAETEAISSSDELNEVLDQLNKVDERYQTYLKTHNFFVRFVINLFWWKSSVDGSYVTCQNVLAKRIADGYGENNMKVLAIGKHFLKSSIHRTLFHKALQQAIRNTYRQKDITGFVWKVINRKGVTSYLVGTIHQGTRAMGQIPGVAEAIACAEKVFTERGNPWWWLIVPYFPMQLDVRFMFVLDQYIVLEALKRKKRIFSLGNYNTEDYVDRKLEEAMNGLFERTNEKFNLRPLLKEGPSKKYFFSELKIDANHPAVTTIAYAFTPQLVRLWQKGNEAEYVKECKLLTPDFFEEHVGNTRTDFWEKNTYETYDSDALLPGVVEQIMETTQPMLIAAGTSHFIGMKSSLVEKLEKAGLEVVRYEKPHSD